MSLELIRNSGESLRCGFLLSLPQIALNHFKGHPMGGYGGALKNLSIGCASANGKAYIHSSGKMEVLDMAKLWTKEYIGDQEGFLESMAAAAQAVVDYFQQKEGIIYINVMNNMSIDCDCVDHPAPVKLEDYGILASTDLLNRIDKQHGVHTIEHAEAIGLGSRKYTIVNIDKYYLERTERTDWPSER